MPGRRVDIPMGGVRFAADATLARDERATIRIDPWGLELPVLGRGSAGTALRVKYDTLPEDVRAPFRRHRRTREICAARRTQRRRLNAS